MPPILSKDTTFSDKKFIAMMLLPFQGDIA